jgi:hypothetical protein
MKKWDFPRAMALFNRFIDQWKTGQARNGVREQQARTYQRGGAAFTSGVTRG